MQALDDSFLFREVRTSNEHRHEARWAWMSVKLAFIHAGLLTPHPSSHGQHCFIHLNGLESTAQTKADAFRGASASVGLYKDKSVCFHVKFLK